MTKRSLKVSILRLSSSSVRVEKEHTRNMLLGFSSNDDGTDVLLVISGGPFRTATAAADIDRPEDRKHTEVLACIAAGALRPTER